MPYLKAGSERECVQSCGQSSDENPINYKWYQNENIKYCTSVTSCSEIDP